MRKTFIIYRVFCKHAHVVCVCAKLLQLCPTLCDPLNCTPTRLLSTESSRQEYWSGLPCHPPRDLLDQGIELAPFMSPALAGGVL